MIRPARKVMVVVDALDRGILVAICRRVTGRAVTAEPARRGSRRFVGVTLGLSDAVVVSEMLDRQGVPADLQ
jgi:hypothetical protein